MATTLKQHFTDEVARLTTRLASQRADVAAQRTALTATRALQISAGDAVRDEGEAVTAARKALTGIPMPADGDPLLVAMENALIGLAEAQAALASADMGVQVQAADLARKEAQQAALEAALADAQRQLDRETRETAARQAMADTLTTGDLAALVIDAGAALTSFESNARARVEGEFPTSATNAKSMLKRARARREIVQQSLQSATTVEAAAFNDDTSALTQAKRAFDNAAAAVRSAAEAAPRLDADRALLKRLAELPAAAPPNSYPIVTRWQHDRLHDATKKTARENALAKLTAIDDAVAAARTAQQAYDTALQAAMKDQPDTTQAEIDAAAPVAGLRTTLTAKIGDIGTARTAMSAAELDIVKSWFACVPETLWEALDKLDTAVARLKTLVGPPTPSNLLTALAAAETALTTALEADRLAARKLLGADLALLRAAALQSAERETAASRAKAYAHSAALF